MYLLIIHHERDDSEHSDTRIGRIGYVQELDASTADEARAAAAAYLRSTPGVLSGAEVGSIALDIVLVSTLDLKGIAEAYQAELEAADEVAAKAEAQAQIAALVTQWPDLKP